MPNAQPPRHNSTPPLEGTLPTGTGIEHEAPRPGLYESVVALGSP